jgi:SAM-dependent methyltransferase
MDDATLRCSICQVRDTEPVYPDATPLLRCHPLLRCRRCGLVFQSDAVSLEELDAAQTHAYGEPERRFAGPVERLVRMARWSRVRMAVRLLPPGGRVLDVGCGRGLFLRMLQERGYQVRGTELSAATAAQATSEVPIDTGELSPGRYPPASFDLISIWHVLEHLRRPDEVLAACHEALAPGGALVIAVPNFASIQARLGGPHWFHLDLPRHLFHFTPETLERLLRHSGFAVERLTTGQWEMDPFGLLQTVLNRLGLRPNGLYDTLRNHEAVRRDLGPATRLALLACLPFGLGLAVPLSAAFRLAGRAGTLRVLARRSS